MLGTLTRTQMGKACFAAMPDKTDIAGILRMCPLGKPPGQGLTCSKSCMLYSQLPLLQSWQTCRHLHANAQSAISAAVLEACYACSLVGVALHPNGTVCVLKMQPDGCQAFTPRVKQQRLTCIQDEASLLLRRTLLEARLEA